MMMKVETCREDVSRLSKLASILGAAFARVQAKSVPLLDGDYRSF